MATSSAPSSRPLFLRTNVRLEADGSPAGGRTLNAGTGGAPRQPTRPKGKIRGYLLAIAAHSLLAALLIIGVHWQTQAPVAVQAELWEPPTTKPDPVPPKPEPKPEPLPPPPKPEVAPTPPAPDPEIALEKARKEKEIKDRQEAERRELEKRELERKQLEQKQAELKQQEQKRQEEARKQDEIDARKAADAKKQAEAKKLAEDKARQEAAKQQESKNRNDYLERLQSMAGGDAPRGPNPRAGAAVGGSAGGATGASDGAYTAKVAGAIRLNTSFAIPSDMTGNPRAQFTVTLLPDCSVTSVRLTRSSGNTAWDQAAERAIQRTDPFPRPNNGACAREFTINSGPRDGQ